MVVLARDCNYRKLYGLFLTVFVMKGPGSPRSSSYFHTDVHSFPSILEVLWLCYAASIMIWLRAFLSVVFLPGMVWGVIPILIVSHTPAQLRFDLGNGWLLGVPPIALGLSTFLWCVWTFAVDGKGTLAPIDPPQEFVASGPYRYVRNPMYVALLVLGIGEVIFFQSWLLVLYVPAVAVMFHLFIVYIEEPALLRRFQNSYAEYLRVVPRWIPRA